MTTTYVAAIDIGASSGVIILGSYESTQEKITITETYRFPNQFIKKDGYDCWMIDSLVHEIKKGLDITCEFLREKGEQLSSISIDTWAVDYVLIDKNGNRLGEAISYRDQRTTGMMAELITQLGKPYIYSKTGIQFMPINTICHLKAFAKHKPDYFDHVAHLLMIPDYLSFMLTGNLNVEYTNATTTQLLNVQTHDWDRDLLDAIGIPHHWFKKPIHPGNQIGTWENSLGEKTPVFACASHDTGSAVFSAPLSAEKNSAYLSSGTWSLMGIENLTPLTNPQALACNLTNEGGYEYRFRILKNIMGLWLLQGYCKENNITDLCNLIQEAKKMPAFLALINPNDSRFLNPPSMTKAIDDFCQEYGEKSPSSPAEYARIIFDSLAFMYRRTIEEIESVTGEKIEQINIVGGGSQNELLNQLCADVCNISVLAGPIEGSGLGNIGSQLVSLDLVQNMNYYREIIKKNFALTQYTPQPNDDINNRYHHFLSLI